MMVAREGIYTILGTLGLFYFRIIMSYKYTEQLVIALTEYLLSLVGQYFLLLNLPLLLQYVG